MKKLILLLCAVLVASTYAQEAKALPLKAAIKMAETVIAETALEKGQKPTRYNYWMYQNYMIAEGIKSMGDTLGRPEFSEYKEKQLMYFCDSFNKIKDKRTKQHYLKPNSLWHSGMVASFVEAQATSDHPEITRGISYFQGMLNKAPKIADGTLTRYKPRWKSKGVQIDDLYMLVPYWVRKSKQSGDTKYLEKAIEETLSYYKYLWNPQTKLMHCLWLEKKPEAKIHHWGRGNGWFVMAIADLLHFVPGNHPKRAELLKVYNNVMDGLMARQNEDGLWHQVLDRPESYTETSCSGMFTYSLLLGFNKGWLPASARTAGIKGWNGLQTKLTEKNQLKDVCVGTDMSEDVQYFFKRPRVTHDQHGTGPYLLAASELIKLNQIYDATITGKEILTPKPAASPKITGASIFGVRPGKPIRFCASATGEKPIEFSADGLPAGVSIDPDTGWITGRAPKQKGDVTITLTAQNSKGSDVRKLTLRVGDTICLTPPMGWNSWYVHSEGVSEKAIREIATAMKTKGLADHGWSYVNIDDCWMGERHPQTKAIQANSKFNDMKAMVDYVNSLGLKVGIYSTPWMSTYAGYIGGSAPNEAGDYSEYYLPKKKRKNPHQVFGRYPNGIKKGLCQVGPVWFVDRDAQQFADWGIDYVKYDWKEWKLDKKNGAFHPTGVHEKKLKSGIIQRFYRDFRALDRDIVLSLSPVHMPGEDKFVPEYSNLWRLTGDIHAEWKRMVAPFSNQLVKRYPLTKPGHYGDLDMLQIGPLGKPNRAEVVFKPSPLKPAEQYHQVTLWCLLTQPLLLSCNIPTMDEFDLNLITNDEVLAVNQDALCKQGYRVRNKQGNYEIWAKDLADGGKAVGMFNISNQEQVLTVTAKELGISGTIRDLWRQKEIGDLEELGGQFSAKVSSHGVVFVKVTRTHGQAAKPLPVNSAIEMAETVAAKTALKKRPNILFAIADDMSHASAYGHKWVSTPHFDKLAREGILFNNAFTSNPKCAPSRAATLGGRHFWQMKAGSIHWNVWPNELKIYTDLLAEAGYRVGLTGKGWAPGDYKKRGGRVHNPAGKVYNTQRKKSPPGISDNNYSGNFKEFLKQRKPGQPFCFWYGAKEPHRGYATGLGIRSGLDPKTVKVPSYYPDHADVRSDLLDYALEVNWFDKHLGEIVEHLREIGELDNTLIIATSDNGAPFPRIKGQIYDEDFRLPMAARWGAVHQGGAVVEDFVNNIDIAPTFLEAAGVAIPEEMSGRSFVDIFQANTSGFIDPKRDFVCVGRENHDLGREGDLGYPVRAIRTRDYLYVHNFAPDRWPAGNPETGFTNCDSSPTKSLILKLHKAGNSQYFEANFGKRPQEQLFELSVDPECMNNLAQNPEYSKIKKALWEQLKTTLIETEDPRILGKGKVFDDYDYIGSDKAQHSWKAYTEGWWKRQRY